MTRLLTIDAQARLNAWHNTSLAVDGVWGSKTQAAYDRAGRKHALRRPPSGLVRVIWHWTAGAEGVIPLERRHYHAIVGQDCRVYMGDHQPEANGVLRAGYAAHTRALNTGSIGVAFDAMAGAVERPFDPGPNPITGGMVEKMAELIADLCETYSIPVTPWTTLSHAEVQGTLGVWQRAKWDTNWLPPMKLPGDPVVVGNLMRTMISEEASSWVA